VPHRRAMCRTLRRASGSCGLALVPWRSCAACVGEGEVVLVRTLAPWPTPLWRTAAYARRVISRAVSSVERQVTRDRVPSFAPCRFLFPVGAHARRCSLARCTLAPILSAVAMRAHTGTLPRAWRLTERHHPLLAEPLCSGECACESGGKTPHLLFSPEPTQAPSRPRRRRRKARRRGSAPRAWKPSSSRHAFEQHIQTGRNGPIVALRPIGVYQKPSAAVQPLGRDQGGPVDFCCRANWAEPTGSTRPSPLGRFRPSDTFGPSKAHLTADC
jgi:hypothetical protein